MDNMIKMILYFIPLFLEAWFAVISFAAVNYVFLFHGLLTSFHFSALNLQFWLLYLSQLSVMFSLSMIFHRVLPRYSQRDFYCVIISYLSLTLHFLELNTKNIELYYFRCKKSIIF